ncbi:GlsB/YeaQ/YmgE family stress response membrane protein, partial [Agrobacterium sp. CMT1]
AVAVLRTFDVFVQDSRLGYFVTAFIGASLLLFVAKLVRR